MSYTHWKHMAHFEAVTGLSHSALRKWVGRKDSLVGKLVTEKRTFYPPRGPFKDILRTINKSLQTYKLPGYFYGTPNGVSQVDNASVHALSQVMYKLDIRKFFPSTHYTKVEDTIERLTPDRTLSRLLTQLCTHAHHLPQGFPTSPRLAEILLEPLARRLYRLSKMHNFELSIYMDDIVLSGDRHLYLLEEKVKQLFVRFGFVLNLSPNKTKIGNLSTGFVVTGVLLNGKNLRTKPSFDESLESARIEIETEKLSSSADPKVIKTLQLRLEGREAWVSQVQRENAKL